MIWPFRKQGTKKRSELTASLAQMLLVDDAAYINFVRQLTKNLNPNGVVMVIVGHNTIKNLHRVARAVIEKYENRLDPIDREDVRALSTIDGLFSDLFKQYDETKINGPENRRIGWLIHGLMLIRAERLAENNPLYHDALAEAWIEMAENTMPFSSALEHSILWSKDEKEGACFMYKKLDKTGSTEWIFLHKMPRFLQQTERARRFCREKGYPWR
jgi:hypothetical protein